ncbi:hypothetical protein ARMGADRAFT_1086787 [Armillaria gallica]|uniref:BEACH domain-containing protein n=1 Tax=Armillaria gallica TaxID=47427 RepID=A0A2H3DFS5_ARMGA|nr:hypothetical protein ARMGADRAFT_1086787 [Armillaria gallica]
MPQKRWINLNFNYLRHGDAIAELLSNFQFSIPKGAPELQHGPTDPVLIPIIPGKVDEGPQVPLLVTPLNKQV